MSTKPFATDPIPGDYRPKAPAIYLLGGMRDGNLMAAGLEIYIEFALPKGSPAENRATILMKGIVLEHEDIWLARAEDVEGADALRDEIRCTIADTLKATLGDSILFSHIGVVATWQHRPPTLQGVGREIQQAMGATG